MARLLTPTIFAFMFASIEACASVLQAGSGYASTLPTTARRAKKVVMTVVLNVEYDHPEPFYWSFGERHTKWIVKTREDLDGFNEKVKEDYENEDGKFTVVYTVRGSSCEQMINYANANLKSVDFITSIRIKCGKKQLILKP